jgi:tetratricopeptide (TPR) repeat protein
VDWSERYERAAARYEAGATRKLDERQLVQLANSAWAAGLSLLMAGDRQAAAEWLRRAAERYRESWDAGAATDAWGRPIGAMKALLVAGDSAEDAAGWTLDAGAARAESPIGRYAAALALLTLGRDEEAARIAETLTGDFPADVAATVAAIARHDAAAYNDAAERVRRSFEEREVYLEEMPVADTSLALEALAARRRLGP